MDGTVASEKHMKNKKKRGSAVGVSETNITCGEMGISMDANMNGAGLESGKGKEKKKGKEKVRKSKTVSSGKEFELESDAVDRDGNEMVEEVKRNSMEVIYTSERANEESVGNKESAVSQDVNRRKKKKEAGLLESEREEIGTKKKAKQLSSGTIRETDTAVGLASTPTTIDSKGKRKMEMMDVENDEGDWSVRGGAEKGRDGSAAKGKTNKKSSARKMKSSDGPETSKSSKKSKKLRRVNFSGDVEVFPLASETTEGEGAEKCLIQGKRFSPREDEMVREAVFDYIKTNQLGEEGLRMVMNCSKYPQLKNCWKEIGTAIPWRPYSAIYYRAHILFERSEKRKWESEELELIRSFHGKNGADWKTLANVLGKHRVHIKDAWRRIKLPNLRKGHWSQEEYQVLFDLVNLDLKLKAFEEKKTKHGMLRDNISWEAISQKMSTRYVASCCTKWYQQLTSSLVSQGLWVDTDDYRLLEALQNLDACCIEDVDWDNLLEHRLGEICRRRWDQMVRYIGGNQEKSFVEQVDLLAGRYCPEMLDYRK